MQIETPAVQIQTSAEREGARASDVRAAVLKDTFLARAGILGALWLAAYATATLIVGSHPTGGKILGDVVYLVPVVAATVLAIVAARRARGRHRRFWRVMAVSNASWLTGELLWAFLELVLRVEPFPSVADVFYLLGLALVIPAIAIGFGGKRRLRMWRAALDASIVVAATGYAGWTLLIAPQLTAGASLATVVGIAYPLLSVATLMVLASFAVTGRGELPRSIALVTLGVIAGALANGAYTYLVALNSYGSGNMINVGWQLEAVLLSLAALVSIRHDEGDAQGGSVGRDPGLPLVLLGLAGCFTMVAVPALHGEVHAGTFVLLGYAIAAVVVRLLLTSAEKTRIAVDLEASLSEQERLAVTDGLTGLHNRRFFEEVLKLEVERTQRNGEATGLLVIDVDRFKRINDRHGHVAGDRVLTEIARRLSTVVRSIDVVARYGGEEFVVVLPALNPTTLAEVADRCRRVVADEPIQVDGRPIDVTMSVGAACLPLHASSTTELVRVADKALYAAKDGGRNAVQVGSGPDDEDPEGLPDSTSVVRFLHKLADQIDARQSSGDHSRAMCRLAAELSDHLGLDAVGRWRTVTAARFHDIGKVSIPQAILSKPGPLTEAEWTVIREHPEEGARLLSLAPDLSDIAPIVAQHHERWDGAGYPHGLRGEAISVEARILAVCDAWTAMLAERVYCPAVPEDEAAAELERCSGTQFDPQVVDAFLAVALDRVG